MYCDIFKSFLSNTNSGLCIINRIGFVLAVQILSGSKYIRKVMTIVYKILKDLKIFVEMYTF